MLANISLPSVLPLSLQPRWLILGGRGLLGNPSGQAFLSGCSPSLCYHTSVLPISRLDYCSCRYLLPFLSPLLNGDVQKLSKQTFHSNIYSSLSSMDLLLSFSMSLAPSHRCYVSPLGSWPPLDYKETHREHACWELQGSELTVSHPQSTHVITWHLS